MENIEENTIEYGPHKPTKKELNRMYQTEFRERNRERLKEKKRAYDARLKNEARLGREMLKIMNATQA